MDSQKPDPAEGLSQSAATLPADLAGEIGGPPARADLTGDAHFQLSYRLQIAGWLGLTLLQAALFFRLNPYGAPYVFKWKQYFFPALFYDVFGALLAGFPFLILWLVLYRRVIPAPLWRSVHAVQIISVAGNLFLNQLDHEIVRFMGARLTASFFRTYVHLPTLKQEQFYDALLADRGGPGLPVVIAVIVPGSYLLWAVWHCRRSLAFRPAAARIGRGAAALLLALPLLVLGYAWKRDTHPLLKRKLQPVILTFYDEFKRGLQTAIQPTDYKSLVSQYQGKWLAGDAGAGWRFDNPEYPCLRTPVGESRVVSGKPWNVVFLQLETFRGWDTGFLRPDRAMSPTPYLDLLATSENSAYWTRCLSFGPPTVNNFMAAHSSIAPHSHQIFTTSFPATEIYALPQAMRSRGYQTEIVTATDPDWDNETYWLSRWYDRVSYQYPNPKRKSDREVFRTAAEKLREIGRGGRPFMMTVVSAENHYPFRSSDPGYPVPEDAEVTQRILATMRYTDDVVREFFDGLRKEPWFGQTIFVIAGDHGYNLGEHDDSPGQQNLYRESLWVPLIIHGVHPRLPRGPRREICSFLDLAPTVADLLDIREPNPWQGHSLVAGERPDAALTFVKWDLAYAETNHYAIFSDAKLPRPLIFRPLEDPLQRTALPASEVPGLVDLLQEARRAAKLNDYLISANRIWKPSSVLH